MENTLGRLLTEKRRSYHLSIADVVTLTGISQGQIHRLENGDVNRVQPAHLEALSTALSIPIADLYAAAGFETTTDLPSFAPYLRAKYRDMPPEVEQELKFAFDLITAKHGYDPVGPKPGEDEFI